jgi:hypothetical protein
MLPKYCFVKKQFDNHRILTRDETFEEHEEDYSSPEDKDEPNLQVESYFIRGHLPYS